MAGDNNLDTAALRDIAEMARVGSSRKVIEDSCFAKGFTTYSGKIHWYRVHPVKCSSAASLREFH